jgi:hypothetical protein
VTIGPAASWPYQAAAGPVRAITLRRAETFILVTSVKELLRICFGYCKEVMAVQNDVLMRI